MSGNGLQAIMTSQATGKFQTYDTKARSNSSMQNQNLTRIYPIPAAEVAHSLTAQIHERLGFGHKPTSGLMILTSSQRSALARALVGAHDAPGKVIHRSSRQSTSMNPKLCRVRRHCGRIAKPTIRPSYFIGAVENESFKKEGKRPCWAGPGSQEGLSFSTAAQQRRDQPRMASTT